MNRLAIITLFMALLPTLLRTGTRHEQTSPTSDTGTTQLPDSITLRLFAGREPTTLAVESSGRLIVDGAGDPARTIRRLAITGAEGGGLLVDGIETAACTLRSASGAAIGLTAGGRTKSVHGRVIVTGRGGTLTAVARIRLRDYLAGALAAETSAGDPIEYLTALAVLQRNYVAGHIGRHSPEADLCDNTHCQLSDAADVTARIRDAVDRATKIGLEDATARPCYYSVNCGGSTLTPAQVWGSFEPGYASVTCDECSGSKWHRWQRRVAARDEVNGLMRSAPPAPFVDDDFKARVGRAIGFNVVLSNTVDRIERRGRTWVVFGRGFGHRIGLCQDGARGLARHGRGAAAILRHYFPTARVTMRDGS